jgi:arylsulfatase A-like enzyme
LIAEHLDIEWDYYHHQKYLKRTPHPGHSYTFVGKKQVFGATTNSEEEYDSYRYATKAIEVLNEEHDKPFFLAVGFGEAHTPLLPPMKYYELFQDLNVQPIIEDDLNDVPAVAKKLAKDGIDHDEVKKGDHWGKLIGSYLALLTFVDAQVGRVVSALDESEYRDNTIVILWSDHGNNYGRKLKRGKFTLWEASTRVPFVIWDTRNRDKAGVCKEPVSLVDIYPTLLELIDAPPIEHLDGQSLVPLLENPKLPRKTPAITMMGRGNYAIRDKDWRYIRYFDGGEELYHTSEDRDEINNLIENPEHASTIERLKAFIPKHEEPMNTTELGKMKFYDADFQTKK